MSVRYNASLLVERERHGDRGFNFDPDVRARVARGLRVHHHPCSQRLLWSEVACPDSDSQPDPGGCAAHECGSDTVRRLDAMAPVRSVLLQPVFGVPRRNRATGARGNVRHTVPHGLDQCLPAVGGDDMLPEEAQTHEHHDPCDYCLV